jgi:hypothetical protein
VRLARTQPLVTSPAGHSMQQPPAATQLEVVQPPVTFTHSTFSSFLTPGNIWHPVPGQSMQQQAAPMDLDHSPEQPMQHQDIELYPAKQHLAGLITHDRPRERQLLDLNQLPARSSSAEADSPKGSPSTD